MIFIQDVIRQIGKDGLPVQFNVEFSVESDDGNLVVVRHTTTLEPIVEIRGRYATDLHIGEIVTLYGMDAQGLLMEWLSYGRVVQDREYGDRVLGELLDTVSSVIHIPKDQISLEVPHPIADFLEVSIPALCGEESAEHANLLVCSYLRHPTREHLSAAEYAVRQMVRYRPNNTAISAVASQLTQAIGVAEKSPEEMGIALKDLSKHHAEWLDQI